ncbi:uncharacterized protein LOC133204000 [Saccostrea echinata]|uniref:uncharacterized protein LOC133204000 n=1 Tax=Saccostrea echinata TaxID=191078 RepID=UPI002A840ED4|nr:uncharacterized protein LOC133204000 [Saccostrea echinata]
MGKSAFILLVIFHAAKCLLAPQSDNETNTGPFPHSHLSETSGASLDTSILHEILSQETALRIHLQKNVETMMNEFASLKASMTNEINSLKQDIAELKTENYELRQNFTALKSFCSQEFQKNASSPAVYLDDLNAISNLKKQVRYLSLSLLDLQKQSSVFNDTLQESFRNMSGNMNSGLKDVMIDILSVKEEQNKIKSSLASLDKTHTQLTSSLKGELNMTLHDLKTSLGRTERQQVDLVNSLSALEWNMSSLVQSETLKIGFTASMSTSDMSTTPERRLVFPHVILNEGNGYNSNDGIFTAPVNGLYLFYSSLSSYSSDTCYCDIVQNGSIKVRIYTYANGNAPNQSAANMALLLLQKNDRIWLKMAFGTRIYSDTNSVSTFSGYLIHVA